MDWHIGCSPTSFGNIIRYWDKNGYPNLVQSSTSDEDLIEWLANDMNTNPDGSTDWNDRVNGMEEYWEDRGYSVDVTRRSIFGRGPFVKKSFSVHQYYIDVFVDGVGVFI
jgi:hypothetical protein